MLPLTWPPSSRRSGQTLGRPDRQMGQRPQDQSGLTVTAAAGFEPLLRRHPRTVRVDHTDQLVTEHQPGMAQAVGATEAAELGTADPRLGDPHPHLAGSGLRVRQLDQLEPADVGEDQGPHQVNSLVAPSCIFWAASAGVSLLLNSWSKFGPNTSLKICCMLPV